MLPHQHIFSVDVEEYFQVHAFERVVARDDWPAYPSRVAACVDRILEMLSARGATGTFFVLGWLAERNPALVRRIADGGHEIASHGWSHTKVTSMTPQTFLEDVRRSRAVLEDVAGVPILGYRAPSFSITPETEWALDVLLEAGYVYDSSLFPIKRANYGFPETPPLPHRIRRKNGVLIEFPMTTMRWNGLRVPAAGGGYFRHFPYAVTRRAFRDCAAAGIPGVFYIHPWEVDPEQPRVRVNWLTRMRHYGGLQSTAGRLADLLSEFRFTSIARCMSESPLLLSDPVGGTRTQLATRA